MAQPSIRTGRLLLALGLALCTPERLMADELTVPVPTIVIYPGDIIRDNILVDRDMALPSGAIGSVFNSRAALIGKVARRTLLPGKPIPVIGVQDPKVVVIGGQVKVVFEDGGLTITTYATALQAGGVGDVIKMRNPESGLILSGVVQPDGSVRVSDG
jgi:flagella basal body P-ring formation protein FlgA